MDLKSLARRAKTAFTVPASTSSDPGTYLPTQPHTLSVLEPDEKRIIADVRYFTMVSNERLVAIMDAVKHIVRVGIPGALVECGVWRGGSVLTMIRTLQLLGVDDRDVYLYDTFEGMTRPSQADTSPFERPALTTWDQTPAGTTPWSWAFDAEIFGLELVQKLILGSGYPPERIHFVQGPVEETLPATIAESVALVRLDTDWYESTMHELVHLYPRMPSGGVLIIDDYGHWEGARRAVDEYFSAQAPPILLARTDYSGRMGVKS